MEPGGWSQRAAAGSWPLWSLILAMLGSPSVQAATGGPFHGHFRRGNARLVLSQDVDRVEGVFVVDKVRYPLRGRVTGAVLSAAVVSPTGDRLDFVATASEAGLTVRMQDGQEEVFARQARGRRKREVLSERLKRELGPKPRQSAAGAATTRGRGRQGGARSRPAAGATLDGSAARGPAYGAEHEGWGFKAPWRWTYEQRGANVVLTSQAEPGVILVSAARGVDRDTFRLAVRQELATVGAFPPLPPLQQVRLREGATAWLVEGRGVGDAGKALWARALGVLSGTVSVMVVGLTEPGPDGARLERMRELVGRVARSVHFHAPLAASARRSVLGEWWLDDLGSGSGGAAVPGVGSVLAFCPDGRFFSTSRFEPGGRGSSGTASGAQAAARWHVTGSGTQGVVTVTHVTGEVLEIPFQAGEDGDGMLFANRPYARSGTSAWCD